MSDSSKDRAALLFEDPEPNAEEQEESLASMSPRSDPNEKSRSTADGDSDPAEEVAEEDLRGWTNIVDKTPSDGYVIIFCWYFAEIESVNNHLDSLNSALDAIEQRNDDIRAQLLELLNSNRAIRQELQEQVRPGGAQQTKEEQRATEAEGDDDDDDVAMQ